MKKKISILALVLGFVLIVLATSTYVSRVKASTPVVVSLNEEGSEEVNEDSVLIEDETVALAPGIARNSKVGFAVTISVIGIAAVVLASTYMAISKNKQEEY